MKPIKTFKNQRGQFSSLGKIILVLIIVAVLITIFSTKTKKNDGAIDNIQSGGCEIANGVCLQSTSTAEDICPDNRVKIAGRTTCAPETDSATQKPVARICCQKLSSDEPTKASECEKAGGICQAPAANGECRDGKTAVTAVTTCQTVDGNKWLCCK